MIKLPSDAQPMRSAEHPLPTTFSSRSTVTPPFSAIILNKLAFGPRPGDMAAFEALGADETAQLTAWVDAQLDPDSIDDSACDARIAATNLVTLNLSRQDLWEQYHRRICPPDDAACLEEGNNGNNRNLPLYELERKTMMLATYSERQLFEVLVNFWHDHFSVQGSMSVVRSMIMHYDRDCIRPFVFGRFRDMLEAIASSSSMLYYLDNYTSSDDGPNENWARELFELHTLGEEHYLGSDLYQWEVPTDEHGQPVGYVDNDVYEAARAFTGWTVSNSDSDSAGDSGQFITIADWHDRFQKFILGKWFFPDQTALNDGQGVLDRLVENRATAVHVCRKLCRKLVADNPEESLVQSAADVFYAQRDAADQLKQVIRHIVLNADWQASWGQKVKRPLELAVSTMRATGVDYQMDYDEGDSGTFLSSYYNPMGQRLFEWPAPNGYPDVASYWLSTSSIFKRFRLVNWLMVDVNVDGEYHTDVVAKTPQDARSATAIVDYWIGQIFGYDISAEERDELIIFMAQGFNADFDLPVDTDSHTQELLRALVGLILMTPSFQWR